MKYKGLSLLFIPAMLVGCAKPLSLEFVPFTSFVDAKELMRDYDDEHFYSKKDVTPVSIIDGEISNLNDLLKHTRTKSVRTSMSTKGEQKLLVVPICFSDSDASSLEKKTTFIQNAFFGETKRTNYDSVAGYYNKSSYGQLTISGEVAPWYNVGINSSNWKNKSSSYMNASNIIVEEAVDYLKQQGTIDLSQYDNNGDGYIDGVYAIYDHELDENGFSNSLFWAYSYYTNKGENGLNNTEPAVNVYSWTSVDTILQKNNKSYTNYLIHEVGHIFGLSDYYNTSSSATDETNYHYQPTGCFDMMDYNIGDHSSFSKYLLNWVSPMVLKDNVSTTIKLKPFTADGSYILVPSSNYNNSPFGEYLLIEYFAPKGLNKFSGSYSYLKRNGETGVYNYPQHHGLRIYHINATLGYFEKGNNTSLICEVNDPDAASKIAGRNVGIDYAYSNSISDTKAAAGDPVLIHLLESSGKNTFLNGTPANNETLFKMGDDFGINHFKDFKFKNGGSPNFTLKVKTISLDEIVIDITHK